MGEGDGRGSKERRAGGREGGRRGARGGIEGREAQEALRNPNRPLTGSPVNRSPRSTVEASTR